MQKLHLIMQKLGVDGKNLRFAENESKKCYADGRMKKTLERGNGMSEEKLFDVNWDQRK